MILKLAIDAFLTTEETRACVDETFRDIHLSKSSTQLFDGSLSEATRRYAGTPTPEVLIVEVGGDKSHVLDGLDALAEVCAPDCRVILIGAANDIELYRASLSRGVTDYLIAPPSPETLLNAILTPFTKPGTKPRGKLIAVMGVRGGVGASTIAHNLAWELGQQSHDDIILIDLDIGSGTSQLAFNIDTRQTLVDALLHPERLDTLLMDRFLHPYDETLKILCSPANLNALGAIDFDALEKMLDLARHMALHVVLDIPHDRHAWALELLDIADEQIIVANPDLTCLRDTKSLQDLLSRRKKDRLPFRLILNRLDAYRKTQILPKDFKDALKLNTLETLAFDPNLFGEAANTGQMIGEIARSSRAAEFFRALSADMLLSGKKKYSPSADMNSASLCRSLLSQAKTKIRSVLHLAARS